MVDEPPICSSSSIWCLHAEVLLMTLRKGAGGWGEKILISLRGGMSDDVRE
jgi:hypothetical protein